MSNKTSISVVIPSYNSEKYIEKCLSSLVSQKANFKYEIIVVDSSKDNTPKIIKEKFPVVKLIYLNEQTLPGKGRNIGVKNAKADIIAFLDSDCIASDNWLQTALESMNNGYNFVGGSIKNANPGLISTSDYIVSFLEYSPKTPRREIKITPSCNFICKKDKYNEIGGFPEDLLTFDDAVFECKLSKKYKILFNPKLIVSHWNRTTIKNYMSHHSNLGKHSAMIRKEYNLTGSALIKNPLFLIFVPFIRIVRISYRIFRWNLNLLPQFILFSPIILLGIGTWSLAFIKVYFKK